MNFKSTFRLTLVMSAVLLAASLGAQSLLAQAAPAASDAVAEPSKMSVVSNLVINEADTITFIIGALSVTALTFIIRGFLQSRMENYIPVESVERIRSMIVNRQHQELLEFTDNDPSFISKTLNPALKRAPNYSSMREAMENAIGEQTAESFRRIEILNIIGNLGPLLGLAGTVVGMMVAFEAMRRSGTADASKLAGGIATALAHTFAGLFLAIPTLACFGILRTMVDRLTTRAALASEELLTMMKPSENKSPVPAPGNVTPPRPAPLPRG
jgi:biopolymer transport protein ExbB